MADFVKNNKIFIVIGFFVLNMWAQKQVSTGAFEVYFDGEVIFSKLESGLNPSISEIVGLIKARLQNPTSPSVGQ